MSCGVVTVAVENIARNFVWKTMSEADHHRDLPFSAEYAKSSRAGCKACGDNIEKDTLRLAVMVQVMKTDTSGVTVQY